MFIEVAAVGLHGHNAFISPVHAHGTPWGSFSIYKTKKNEILEDGRGKGYGHCSSLDRDIWGCAARTSCLESPRVVKKEKGAFIARVTPPRAILEKLRILMHSLQGVTTSSSHPFATPR